MIEKYGLTAAAILIFAAVANFYLQYRASNFNWQGMSHRERGDYTKAVEAYTQAIDSHAFQRTRLRGRLAVELARCLNNRARAYEELGSFDKAFEDYNAALAIYEDRYSKGDQGAAIALAETLRNRGNVLQQQGSFVQAMTDYRRAISMQREFGQKEGLAYSLNSAAWVYATCPQRDLRDGALAVKYAEEAMALADPDPADFLDTAAAAYAELGDFVRAVDFQRCAVKFVSDDRKPQLQLRLDLYQQKKPFRAAEPR